MRRIRRTSQFKKDVRRDQKRGKDLGKLKVVIEKLVRKGTAWGEVPPVVLLDDGVDGLRR